MAVLFLEIGCEEIPARLQKNAIAHLQTSMTEGLEKLGFAPDGARTAISPRHMALELSGLAEQLEDQVIEKRGPRTDALDKAIDGFCQSAGLKRSELVEQETEKGRFYFARTIQKGVHLNQALPDLVQNLIAEFAWPKSQRWAHSRVSWVRPLRSLSLLIDGKPVQGELDLGGDMRLVYGASTQGHPFHAGDQIKLSDFDSYLKDMRSAFVIVCPKERREMIKNQLSVVAAERGLKPVDDAGLLDEITGLVEWPQVIIGDIEPAFMTLPPEILVTSMRVHQKFFALSKTGKPDKLAPFFMTVANRKADQTNQQLIAKGNERVLRARLSDARFFWEQDKAHPINAFLPALSSVTFYEGLGTLAQKAERMAELAGFIASHIEGCNTDMASHAACLAKADLVSGMVGEFPELQGIMGGYYAAESGEVAEISHAIAEHYRPQGPSDRIPQTPIGLCVSLADKLETLVGFFGIGQKPTGSRDPFGLRRAALGIIAMIDEAELNIPLAVLCEKAAQLHGLDLTNAELDLFIIERLRGRLRDKGYAHDVIAAILAGPDGARKIDVLLQTCRLVDALSQFVDSDKGQQLISGWRRVSSILEAEEKNTEISMHIDESLFADKAEKGLYQALQNMPETDLSDRKQMEQTMRNLASLSEPINQFFDNVIVNSAENSVRENRLAMLAQIRKTMRGIADFGQLEG